MSRDKDTKTVYVCRLCGQTSAKWLGRCPGCGEWHTLVDEPVDTLVRKGRSLLSASQSAPLPLLEVSTDVDEARIFIGMNEMDRVLGGGLVPGSLVLLAGEPGIGKSTLLLQILCHLASNQKKILYVSGEESLAQIRMRSERLGKIPESLWVACESELDRIIEIVKEQSPSVLAVDSIQTMFCGEILSAPGSVAQVREATARLMQLAKSKGIPTILVGHVTKEGAIAGPRVLEHLVDTVLYFEGDRSHTFRLLRTVKNRYGPTHEIGVFEMTEAGLKQVPNPSEVFLGQRPKAVPGSVIVPCMEGTRPILVEIQALVSPSHLAMPRRTSTGIDSSRLALLIAVAERHLGVALFDRDIFINVVGGLKISEPASELAVIMAMVSSLRDVPLNMDTAVFGEVGLTGEVRAVGRTELRLNEAARLGLKRCIIPQAGSHRLKFSDSLEILPVKRIDEAVAAMSKVS
ncbi:MAG: DNA repair protein RadA [Deltaproteobacteria bacterium]|nr:DNA repair protein RadA [Deltaproteobacteria bacterium]MBW1938527.1 DNA repair protein RadA [Deltaproteobacteria bacterium]MBW1964861.1 DNA repair protein RadA [Deltaproteobacteria bacterium]MBW2080754.1 DNA repair protein RadA [Deltaproteobacteria bacterium]MBW2349827.1 DNA repair protein RadA [Deltaproteobacteria bacterium]